MSLRRILPEPEDIDTPPAGIRSVNEKSTTEAER